MDGWLKDWMRNPSWRSASMCLEEAADRCLKPKRVTDGRRARRRLQIHSPPPAQLTRTHHFFCFGGGLRTKKKMHGYHRYTHSRYYVYRQMQCFWCRSVSDKFNENQYGREGGSLVRWLRCLSGSWSGDWSHVVLMLPSASLCTYSKSQKRSETILWAVRLQLDLVPNTDTYL